MDAVFDERRYLIPFRTALLPQIFTDVLVIGAGVAGLRAALSASQFGDVIVTTKGPVEQSNTYLAQGGVAAVVSPGAANGLGADSVEAHMADTLAAGADLCDEPVVRQTVGAAGARIDELIRWGMNFDRTRPADVTSPIALGREGAHSQARILHADGDATGREMVLTLLRQVRSQERVRVFDHCLALDLLTVEAANGTGPQCVGAITHHPKFGLQVIWAAAVILASGGCGQVYRESTNPPVATGDGIAMAYRAGAAVADMAFMQFHPTTLYVAGAARSLISEAVRGEGAVLIDHDGSQFMPDYDERADLAPRDVVSRSILAQVAKTRFPHVFLDCRGIGREKFAARFPGIYRVLKQFGIDPGKDPIPVYPSAHYMVGGVHTDHCGRTNVTGLYACGEASCTGLHGANRLASNSLLEGLVFGEIVGRICRETLSTSPTEPARGQKPIKIVSDIRLSEQLELDLADVRSSLRSAMWQQVGIERSGDRLSEAAGRFDFWARYTLDKIFDDRLGWEVQNLLLVGALITRSALWRTESRGTHYRTDYPQPRAEFRCHDLWIKGRATPEQVAVKGAGVGEPAIVGPKE